MNYERRERTRKEEGTATETPGIVLEIKAVRELDDQHRAQIINYLKSTGMALGLLINFGHFPRLQHERFVNQPGSAR